MDKLSHNDGKKERMNARCMLPTHFPETGLVQPEDKMCYRCFHNMDKVYEMEEYLGRGSFGKVFRISGHGHSKSTIAVKEIPTHIFVSWHKLSDDIEISRYDTKELEEKFGEGTWLDSSVRAHENVISFGNVHFRCHTVNKILRPLYNGTDAVKADGHAYIEMEECYRKTLADWIRDNMGERPIRNMKIWIRQLLSALEWLHNHGIIHRDLKPDNIFFKQNGNSPYGLDGILKIGDFGMIKRCFDENENVINNHESKELRDYVKVYGTALYNAPEKEKKRYNNKVDVFSLGLIATELIIPIKKEHVRNTVFKVLKEGQSAILVGKQPVEVKNFIISATNPDPELRPFATQLLQHEFFDDLSDLLAEKCEISDE